ncbi:MAG TPA: hypothetical protein V6C81_29370 [Planktothrix sp.]|jgi:hypothetical protein
MFSQLQTGLNCPDCQAKTLGTIKFQCGNTRLSRRATVEHLAVNVEGVSYCGECGRILRSSAVKEIPQLVGAVIAALVAKCFYRVDGVVERGLECCSVKLENRAVQNMPVTITWGRNLHIPQMTEEEYNHQVALYGEPAEPNPLVEHTINTLWGLGLNPAAVDLGQVGQIVTSMSKTVESYRAEVNPGASARLDYAALPRESVETPIQILVNIAFSRE